MNKSHCERNKRPEHFCTRLSHKIVATCLSHKIVATCLSHKIVATYSVLALMRYDLLSVLFRVTLPYIFNILFDLIVCGICPVGTSSPFADPLSISHAV